jgi:hypothetical protein
MYTFILFFCTVDVLVYALHSKDGGWEWKSRQLEKVSVQKRFAMETK